jgi:hypothetical protein
MSAGMAYALFIGLPIFLLFFGLIGFFGDDDSAAYRWARLRAGADRMITRIFPLPQARLAYSPIGPPAAEPEDAHGLDGGRLRRAARSEVEELAEALAAAQGDRGNPGRDRALACYDAAALLVAERKDRLDLLGALVLAREGQSALADRDPLPRPACQVHPLHGAAFRRSRRGQRSPQARKLRAVCAGCAGCSGPERDQRALLEDGVPYYRTTGFWAQVGFGALDAELPARVLEYLGVE